MPTRQLCIRSDEAAERAGRLARRLGKTTSEVVVEALRSHEAATSPLVDESGLTTEQRRRYDVLMSTARDISRHIAPDMDLSGDWLYDENGQPA